jgi:hypothetical protein
VGAKGLSDARVRELRTRRVVNGEDLTALAREFGVSGSHAYRIVIGEHRISAGGPLYEPGAAPLTGRAAVATPLNADDRELVLKLADAGAKPECVATVMVCTLEQVEQALEGR